MPDEPQEVKTTTLEAVQKKNQGETTESPLEQPKEEPKKDAFKALQETYNLSEREISDAAKIFNILRDDQNPQKGTQLLKTLAQARGLHFSEEPTVSEPKKTPEPQEVALEDKVSAALGKEYSFLGPGITNAIQLIIREQVEGPLNELSVRTRANDINTLVRDTLREQKVTASDDVRSVMGKVQTLFKQMPPAEGVDTSQYVNNLITLAINSDIDIKEKIENAKKNAVNSAQAGDVSGFNVENVKVRRTPDNVTLNQAIDAAMNNEVFED